MSNISKQRKTFFILSTIGLRGGVASREHPASSRASSTLALSA